MHVPGDETEEQAVTVYRVYTLSAVGRIMGGSYVECIDDNEAHALVQTKLRGNNMAELWDGIRRIGIVSAKAEQVIIPRQPVQAAQGIQQA